MPVVQRDAIPGVAVEDPAASVNAYGDLVCPRCGLAHITPEFLFVLPGRGECLRCRLAFRVTPATAEQANTRAEQFMDRTGVAYGNRTTETAPDHDDGT